MRLRRAREDDLPSIVEMLADDEISDNERREDFSYPLPKPYYKAFEKIDADKNQDLIVMEADDGQVIGTLQLTFIQCLCYRGQVVAQIEAVRVREGYRSKGLGKGMVEWAIERARERKVYMVQLASNKNRLNAIRFYESLGFKKSHEGMKFHLGY